MKNKVVMQSLNPALAEDAQTRDKKRQEWSKSLNEKVKKLDILRDKRKQSLWAELRTKRGRNGQRVSMKRLRS